MKKSLTISVDVSEKTLKKVKIYCINNDITFKDFATLAIKEKAVKLGIIKDEF